MPHNDNPTRESREAVANAVDQAQSRFKESLAAAYSSACEHGKEVVDKSRTTIAQNPFIAVGGAFVAGVVFAMLVGRWRNGHSD